MTRLQYVLDLINRFLGGFNPLIKVVEHYIANDKESEEYLQLRIRFRHVNALVMLREYWCRGTLIAYGYYMRIGSYEEWWDNRPHHPEVPTHPHHRHLEGRVHPLQDPSLENFLRRVKELLTTDIRML